MFAIVKLIVLVKNVGKKQASLEKIYKQHLISFLLKLVCSYVLIFKSSFSVQSISVSLDTLTVDINLLHTEDCALYSIPQNGIVPLLR